MAQGSSRIWALAAVAAVLLAMPAWAAPVKDATSGNNATCYLENGIIHVQNLPPNVVCVGRSDDPSDDALPSNGANVTFGLPALSTNVTVLFFFDAQCLQADSFVTCSVLPNTFCFITSNNTVEVNNIPSDVECITRADNTTDMIIGTNLNSSMAFAAPAQSDDILLRFFSDTGCSQVIRTNPFIFCQPLNTTNGTTSNTTCPFTVTQILTPTIVPVPVTVTVTVPATSQSIVTQTSTLAPVTTTVFTSFSTSPTPLTTATPTTTTTVSSSCDLPTSPVCYVQSTHVHLRNLGSNVECVQRSDQSAFAFPQNGSIDFGLPAQSSSITVTLLPNANCSGPAVGTLSCINLASSCSSIIFTTTPVVTVTLV